MNILILRSGLLGDTLVAVPALWALRRAYPDAHIRYVMEVVAGQDYVRAEEILAGGGLVNSFDAFYSGLPPVRQIWSRMALLLRLRQKHWDVGISLAEPFWSPKKKRFAQLCGAKMVLGPEGKGERHPRAADGSLLRVPHIADTLIQVLQPLGIPLPEAQQGRVDVALHAADEAQASAWLNEVGVQRAARPWIALGLWSNMPIKRWPLDRYATVVKALISEFDIVPFVFGGASEHQIGAEFVREMGRGYVLCGKLPVRPSLCIMQKCSLYLGNDTGTMHMAVSGGLSCVAIFSSRDSPGRWKPYGSGHTVFRKPTSCEGCMLREGPDEKGCGIMQIDPDEVLSACRKMLRGGPSPAP